MALAIMRLAVVRQRPSPSLLGAALQEMDPAILPAGSRAQVSIHKQENSMIHTHAEQRSLFEWLTMQERVLRLWIDEAVSAAPSNTDFISRLEVHHTWLLEQIDYVAGRHAA